MVKPIHTNTCTYTYIKKIKMSVVTFVKMYVQTDTQKENREIGRCVDQQPHLHLIRASLHWWTNSWESKQHGQKLHTDDRDDTHTTAQKHKPKDLSYLSCQFRVSQAASTVVFKIFHLYSHRTEQERGEWERDRERWEGERITINRIMRQGPVQKDLSLRTVGLPGITCMPFHTQSLHHSCHPQQTSKSSRAHKSLFFDLCSNSEPALPSTAGTENERQQSEVQFQL